MPDNKPIIAYTEKELRQMLANKLHSKRKDRLERFRNTGRAVILVPDSETNELTDLHSKLVDEQGENTISTNRAKGKGIIDYLLLVFEVSVVMGLILIVWSGIGLQTRLNLETTKAWDLPTLTPTPLIRALVLPSGHTPPTSPGGTRPNDSEIPAHLRPLAQSLAQAPIPTQSPQHGIRIRIPSIAVDAPIIQGDNWEQLKKGVAQHIGTANPGQNGNMVLSGHNDVFGEVFRYLDQLNPGDEIIIYTSQRSYTYVVSDWQVVEPTEVSVMDPTLDATTTLISCYPYLVDDQRIIVKAKLKAT
jgi:sortase A